MSRALGSPFSGLYGLGALLDAGREGKSSDALGPRPTLDEDEIVCPEYDEVLPPTNKGKREAEEKVDISVRQCVEDLSSSMGQLSRGSKGAAQSIPAWTQI